MKNCSHLRFQQVLLILCLFSVFIFSSCKEKETPPRMYLDDVFYWARTNALSTPEDAMELEYEHLDNMGYKNLMDLVGREGAYVWLKAEFELPPELKDEDLSMVIPYLHFADELYLNELHIKDYGVMQGGLANPLIQEAGYVAHLFDFPRVYLNQNGKNTILIKVFCLGHATITDGVFIGLRQDGERTSDNMTFWRSRFYMFFEGMMLVCCVFFTMLYFLFNRRVSYRRFALLNLFTALFFSIFFITDIPWAGFHGGIPFLIYVKFAKSICFFAIEFVLSMFICNFIEYKLSKFEIAVQYLSFIISSAMVLYSPDYVWLFSKTLVLIPISCFGLICSLAYTIISLKKPDVQTKARFVLIAMIFLLTVMGADIIIKGAFRNIKMPFISIFGLTGVIIIFFVYFCLDYSKIAHRLEYLNKGLESEIRLQTEKLTNANSRLEHDREVSIKDMRMAAIVQKKYFHAPEHPLKNWDFAVRYEPLALVSGDFFNFYHEGDSLKGISLFDASGHGVAASLVTMLAENVIQQTYIEMLENHTHENVADGLQLINERFIEAKGEIENYLTGILLSAKENSDGSCTLFMSNAGHPYPLFYNAEENTVEELLPSAEMPYTGPVGLSGLDVEYSQLSFTMKKGDILFLYTDGITEMSNEEKLDFGIEPVAKILQKFNSDTAENIISKIMQRLDEFIADTPRVDDVSVIILKRT